MGPGSKVTIGLCLLLGLATSILVAWTAAWTSTGPREIKLIMPSQGDEWGVVQCSKQATTYFISVGPNGNSSLPLESPLSIAALIADLFEDQKYFGVYSTDLRPTFGAAINPSDTIYPAHENVIVLSTMKDGALSWANDKHDHHLPTLTQASGFPMPCLLSRVQGLATRPERTQRSGALVLSSQAQDRHPRWPDSAFSSTLPIVPIWSGLAVNTLAYGSIPFLILVVSQQIRSVFQRLRNKKHQRRGHCPKCNYNLLADFTTGCPECGWGREEQEANAPG